MIGHFKYQPYKQVRIFITILTFEISSRDLRIETCALIAKMEKLEEIDTFPGCDLVKLEGDSRNS